MFWRCKNCEALRTNCRILERQNAYLQKFVDKLLVRAGIAPIKKEKPEPEPEPTEEEKVLINGGDVLGGDD